MKTLEKYNNADTMVKRHSDLKYFTTESRVKHMRTIEYAFTHECGVAEEQFHQLRDISLASERIESGVLFHDQYTVKEENAMVQYAVVFEAVYNSLKLGIDWKKLAEYKRKEQRYSFDDYIKELGDAYDIPGCPWYSEDVNLKEWFASEKALYSHRDRVTRIYDYVYGEVKDAIYDTFSEFNEEFDDLENRGEEYINALRHHIYGIDVVEYFPCNANIEHMLKCAYVIYCIGDNLCIG